MEFPAVDLDAFVATYRRTITLKISIENCLVEAKDVHRYACMAIYFFYILAQDIIYL